MPLDRPIALTILIAFCALLTACATTARPPVSTATRQEGARSQLKLNLPSGVYRCEENQRIAVLREANSITLDWQGRRRTLRRYHSESGLPRFEDRENGLLWVDLPWKSVLMDITNERPLANDCKATSS